jgi:hypothetical protein
MEDHLPPWYLFVIYAKRKLGNIVYDSQRIGWDIFAKASIWNDMKNSLYPEIQAPPLQISLCLLAQLHSESQWISIKV